MQPHCDYASSNLVGEPIGKDSYKQEEEEKFLQLFQLS